MGKKFSVELRAIVQTLFWKSSNGIFLEVLFQTLDDGYSAFYELRSGDLFVHPDITICHFLNHVGGRFGKPFIFVRIGMPFEPQAQKFLVEIFRLLPRFHALGVGCELPVA